MNNTCITNLLKYICLLQDNSTNTCINEGCIKPYLGNISIDCFNTRVISLYKKDGSLYEVNYDSSNTSSLFRIMSINNNSTTLLILTNNGDTYTSTKVYTTIDTSCICAVRCITDTLINL